MADKYHLVGKSSGHWLHFLQTHLWYSTRYQGYCWIFTHKWHFLF